MPAFNPLLAGLAGVALALLAVSSRADDVEVIDGDTLLVNGQPVRLLGVDAPARDELCGPLDARTACGQQAAQELERLVAGAAVACEGLQGPRFGEVIVASCSADGLDLGLVMVRSGWARADLRYASRYEHVEEEARAARRGIWAGEPADSQ